MKCLVVFTIFDDMSKHTIILHSIGDVIEMQDFIHTAGFSFTSLMIWKD